MAAFSEIERAHLVRDIAHDIRVAFDRIGYASNDPTLQAATLAAEAAVSRMLDTDVTPTGRAMRHVGYYNPKSGNLHKVKMDLHPGRDWRRLWIYALADEEPA